MDGAESGSTQLAEAEETYCYAHTKTPTRLRCSRCDRPICGRCAIPASVGQHCPECVAEARRSQRRVKSVARATAPVVMGLIGINILMFVGQQAVPGLTERLSASVGGIDSGQWWRLFTAMFLHDPRFIFHILFNMYVLYIYGPHVEQAFGSVRFVALYVICGFGASALSYAGNGCLSSSVGASGAIFGVVGLLLVYLYNRRHSSFVAAYLRTLIFFIGLNLVIGFVFPRIDNLAHIGGLASGVALGLGFDRVGTPRGAVLPLQILTAVAVAGTAFGLVIYRTTTINCSLPFFLG